HLEGGPRCRAPPGGRLPGMAHRPRHRPRRRRHRPHRPAPRLPPAHEGRAGPHRPDVVGRRLVPPHRRPRLRRRPPRRPAVLAAVLAPLAGTAAFLAWVGVKFGDALLPFRVQNIDGLRGHTVSPLATVATAVSNLLTGDLGRHLHFPWVLAAVALVVVLLLRWP